MCGRIAAYTPPPKLARALAAGIAADADDHWRPSFNIPPAKRLYACRLDHGGERLLQPFGWGLIPPWAKDPRIGSKAFNARAENVATKPMFRQAFRNITPSSPSTASTSGAGASRASSPSTFPS